MGDRRKDGVHLMAEDVTYQLYRQSVVEQLLVLADVIEQGWEVAD
jgi:hypothetical protein